MLAQDRSPVPRTVSCENSITSILRPRVVVVVETDQLLPLSPPRDQHGNQDDGDGNQHPVLERHTQERDSLC
jgi:hypothetical protein